MESFDDNQQYQLNNQTNLNSSLTIYSGSRENLAETDPSLNLNDSNFIYHQLLDLDENIILCWENYAVPLQELVKSTSIYERNMLEYYRQV